MVDDGRTDGRTTDGRTPDHGHPISSPCEPDGSGELKRNEAASVRDKQSFESVHEKANNLGSEQVGHKLSCTVTEDV